MTGISEMVLRDQGDGDQTLRLEIVPTSTGALLIKPEGYGDKVSQKDQGYPIMVEILEGRLRVVLWDDINQEDPHVIDMEGARETNRSE